MYQYYKGIFIYYREEYDVILTGGSGEFLYFSRVVAKRRS